MPRAGEAWDRRCGAEPLTDRVDEYNREDAYVRNYYISIS